MQEGAQLLTAAESEIFALFLLFLAAADKSRVSRWDMVARRAWEVRLFCFQSRLLALAEPCSAKRNNAKAILKIPMGKWWATELTNTWSRMVPVLQNGPHFPIEKFAAFGRSTFLFVEGQEGRRSYQLRGFAIHPRCGFTFRSCDLARLGKEKKVAPLPNQKSVRQKPRGDRQGAALGGCLLVRLQRNFLGSYWSMRRSRQNRAPAGCERAH